MIYTGVNRLENWLIDNLDSQPSVSQFVRGMLVEEIDDVPTSVVEMMIPEAAAIETFVSSDTNYRRTIGSAMVRAGVAILLVPDPIPLVDEIGGAALVLIGGVLVATS